MQAIPQTVDEIPEDMKDQSPTNFAVAGDAHASGSESLDEVITSDERAPLFKLPLITCYNYVV